MKIIEHTDKNKICGYGGAAKFLVDNGRFYHCSTSYVQYLVAKGTIKSEKETIAGQPYPINVFSKADLLKLPVQKQLTGPEMIKDLGVRAEIGELHRRLAILEGEKEELKQLLTKKRPPAKSFNKIPITADNGDELTSEEILQYTKDNNIPGDWRGPALMERYANKEIGRGEKYIKGRGMVFIFYKSDIDKFKP